MIDATTQPASLAPSIVVGAITWFEIPAREIDMATRFYEGALDTHLKREDFAHMRLAMFPCSASGQRGCLAEGAGLEPSEHGTIVYLAVPDIEAAVARWTKAGGQALGPIIDLPAGIGRIAHMLDAGGTRVGLHQLGTRD